MIAVIVVVCGAVAAWILVDHLLSRHAQRGGQFGPNRVFHSTGFEDTVPPAYAEPRPGIAARQRLVR